MFFNEELLIRNINNKYMKILINMKIIYINLANIIRLLWLYSNNNNNDDIKMPINAKN